MSSPSDPVCDGVIIRPHWLAMVREILQRYVPDREVRVFGSRATGGNRPFSDLDIAICGDLPLEEATLFDLREALEESDLPINVDVVQLSMAGPHINEAVAQHGVTIQAARQSGQASQPRTT